MSFSIAHLGPAGTYAEQAALAYAQWWSDQTQQPLPQLKPYASMAQTLHAADRGETEMAIVPVENSIEGGVTTTLDTLWQAEQLEIRQALVLPIVHVLVTPATDLASLQMVYSHPQPLGQCQQWLSRNLPHSQLIPTHSTTDALQYIGTDVSVAAIASERAAHLYHLHILASAIQDYPDNCTRFLVLTQPDAPIAVPFVSQATVHTSLAFSLQRNVPGSLVTPLQIFADRHINLSRIESRPAKRSLGDYVFFIDAEADLATEPMQDAIALLRQHTETLNIFGTYRTIQVS
ncbi:MAG: prephenate dehydratase [Thermosynechococcaceae cyanobacterium]